MREYLKSLRRRFLLDKTLGDEEPEPSTRRSSTREPARTRSSSRQPEAARRRWRPTSSAGSANTRSGSHTEKN